MYCSFYVCHRSRAVVSLPATVADAGLPFALPRNISRTNSNTGSSSKAGLNPREIIFPITLFRLLRAIITSNTWCGLSKMRPVNNSNKVTPRENMSERTVMSLGLRDCSGDMYFIVPSPCCLVTVNVPDTAEARKSPHLVTPKSPSLTNVGTCLSSVVERKMLAGFTSRWMTL